MTTIIFDTHAFIKKLTESGLTEQQAEAITEIQKETVSTTLEQARHITISMIWEQNET